MSNLRDVLRDDSRATQGHLRPRPQGWSRGGGTASTGTSTQLSNDTVSLDELRLLERATQPLSDESRFHHRGEQPRTSGCCSSVRILHLQLRLHLFQGPKQTSDWFVFFAQKQESQSRERDLRTFAAFFCPSHGHPTNVNFANHCLRR